MSEVGTGTLTAAQRASWDERGFFRISAFAPRATCEAMLARVTAIVRDRGLAAGLGARVTPENNKAGRAVANPEDAVSKVFKLHRDTVFAEFAHSAEVVDPVSELITPDIDVFLSQFIFKTAGAWGQPWHQDSFYFPFEPARPVVGVWLAVTEATLQNGCLITDVRMPDMTGIELLQRLRAKDMKFPVIVITGHGDIPLAVEAMKSGAIDFIEKPFAEEAILRAVRAAKDRARKLGRRSEEEAQVASRLASLSDRERQVLDGLVAGHANKTIAHELGISPRTVEVYRAHLMTKMQAKSLSELIRMTHAARALD